MDKLHYSEMVEKFRVLLQNGKLVNRTIYVFGHCNATESLIDLFLKNDFYVSAILDNNCEKHGKMYRGIPIVCPKEILLEHQHNVIVCIVARAYAAMADQLKRMGYKGKIYKLVDYNSYANYSLSDEVIKTMTDRVERGKVLSWSLNKKYQGCFRILCPFQALGDIYYMMSYLPYYLKKKSIQKCIIGVIGYACSQVVRLFGEYNVEVFSQREMDELIQAALYTQDDCTFIPHQDRPYVVNVHNALYIKCLPLDQIYCCGVFGLPQDTKPIEPDRFCDYPQLENIDKGNAVIFSPYAKSVTALDNAVWKTIVEYFLQHGFQCYTNVVGDEEALYGTIPISPKICEMKSVVERAGMFVGIRSGLCDILRTANAVKIALYPDYNYCDTRWKAIDIYSIEGWNNKIVKDDFVWTMK